MNETELLKYGFIIYLKGEATYDHLVQAKMPYANGLIEELQSTRHPVIAQRYYPSAENGQGVSSPLFRYISPKSGISSYQSAYYLADALMRKGVLPVYIKATGEVKDLMPLLTREQKQDAIIIMQILRARYIKAEKRRPAKSFMIIDESTSYDAETIEISNDDMLRIFGRMPSESDNKVVPLRVVSEQAPASKPQQYIGDELASRA